MAEETTRVLLLDDHEVVRRGLAQLIDAQTDMTVDLIAEGMTNREIGERMHLAEKTVKNYVTSLLAKLGLQRRTQAALYVTKARTEPGSAGRG